MVQSKLLFSLAHFPPADKTCMKAFLSHYVVAPQTFPPARANALVPI